MSAAGVTKGPVFQARRLQVLEDLGAVSPRQKRLITRAAGLLAHEDLEPNAISVTAEVLQQLDLPEVNASLFPAEKRLQPSLWKKLEWEELPAMAAPCELPECVATDISKVSLHPQDRDPTALEQLPELLRPIARRVLLICDVDASTGISLPNLETVLDHPAFLQEERSLLAELRRTMIDLLETSAPTMKAVLEVPTPGDHLVEIDHAGSTPAFVVNSINIHETAEAAGDGSSLKRQLNLIRNTFVELHVAEGEQLLVMNHDRRWVDSDILLGEGKHRLDLYPCDFRLERWKDGERLESSDFSLKGLKTKENVNLTPYAQYQLRTNGDPLPRVLTKVVDLTNMHNTGATSQTGHFSYSFDTKADPALDGTPFEPTWKLDAAPGRYQATHQLVIDVFDNGAARAKWGDNDFQPMALDPKGFMAAKFPSDNPSYPYAVSLGADGVLNVPSGDIYKPDRITLGQKFRVN